MKTKAGNIIRKNEVRGEYGRVKSKGKDKKIESFNLGTLYRRNYTINEVLKN